MIYILILCLLGVLKVHALQRRLGAYVCAADSFVLAQGAPTLRRGRSFSDVPGKYVDARLDATGKGTALLTKMPFCLREKSISVKINGSAIALNNAVKWIDAKCFEKDCIVFSDYKVEGHFKVVY